MSASLRVAFVLPYGERSDGFFPDTFLGQLCADARAAGHDARVVRVYYEGDRGAGDAEVARRLTAWLVDGGFDLVVLERVFDAAPLRAFRDAAPAARVALVVRGDSIEVADGVDLVVGAWRGDARTGRTRRAVTIWQIADACVALIAAVAAGADPAALPGVGRRGADGVVAAAPLPATADTTRPLRPVLDHEVIAVGPPPAVTRRTVFGNAGCPYAADPLAAPHFAGVTLPTTIEVARLGCAFCAMGGDYERRPDAEVVASIVDQALHITRGAPATRELVLDDQAALRYLAALIRAAAAAGVPPVRWLFAARSDTLVRERARLDAAIAAAEATGHVVECYLTGFEAFSAAELARYHKGVTVDDQLAAVATLRARTAAHPTAFRHADARGHSLILWNPWTTPDDLADTVAIVRGHGLVDLFDELGRNRLRLYPDLPIFHAAARDGALVDAWQPGDHGAARGKGYHQERPWRFLDPRTRLAWELAEALRARLGRATEPAQLAAIAAHARAWRGGGADVAAERDRVDAGVARLAATLARLCGDDRAPGDPGRGAQARAEVVRLTGACNDGCVACPNRDRHLPDDTAAVIARIVAARAAGRPIVLAGREPTLRDDLPALLDAARGDDRRAVGVVSNGRRFAYDDFTAAARGRGLAAVSLKLFAADDAGADAIARVDGAQAQARRGAAALRRAGIAALELRAPLDAGNLAGYAGYAALAGALDVDQLRVEAAIDAVSLDALGDGRAAAALDALLAACRAADVAVEAAPLTAGTSLHHWLPAPRPRRGAGGAATPGRIAP